MALTFNINNEKGVIEFPIDLFIADRKIKVDSMGHRYFDVPNLLNTRSASVTRHLFEGRIKDAVNTIKNGDGDVLAVSEFAAIETVVYYLDRSYGDMVREKFLKGWANTVFAYAIKYDGIRELDTDDNFHIPATPTRYFDTEEEAEEHLNNLIALASQDAKLYKTLSDEEEERFCVEEYGNFSDARQELLLWKLATEKTSNRSCHFHVVQTIRKD